ncbi:hypothetical protein ACWC24_09065 [Streptomyces sp. NPDC001443]
MRNRENRRDNGIDTDLPPVHVPSPAPAHNLLGLQATAGNTAVVQMLQQGEQPLQRVATRSDTGSTPLPVWSTFPWQWAAPAYGPANNGGPLNRMGGTSVTVTLGPSICAPGNTYSGSRPGSDQCTLVDELNTRDGSGWVKGHLWNDNLGGKGISANLTPMTSTTNASFNRSFEEPLKRMLLKCANHAQNNANSPVWYGVTFNVHTYGSMSTNPNELEYYVPEGVEYTATYVQMDRQTQNIAPVAAPTGFPAVIL